MTRLPLAACVALALASCDSQAQRRWAALEAAHCSELEAPDEVAAELDAIEAQLAARRADIAGLAGRARTPAEQIANLERTHDIEQRATVVELKSSGFLQRRLILEEANPRWLDGSADPVALGIVAWRSAHCGNDVGAEGLSCIDHDARKLVEIREQWLAERARVARACAREPASGR